VRKNEVSGLVRFPTLVGQKKKKKKSQVTLEQKEATNLERGCDWQLPG